MLRFESPWMFLLLLAIPALTYWSMHSGSRASLRFSSTASAETLAKSWKQRLAFLPGLLRVLALVGIVIALARPQQGAERVRDISRGAAMHMVVDRSSSMKAQMNLDGRAVTRLEAVKRVFRDFIDPASGDMPGRPNDLIGMIAFARYADTICPLTLSHDTLGELLPTVRLAEHPNEDGTAIGDAVALAAARLQQAETFLREKSGGSRDYEIKSKVVILLTDGENNAGDRGVQDAAELCKEWGIKIYAIGVGGTRGRQTPFGTLTTPFRQGFDDRALRAAAETTGGIYRLATDSNSLRDIYAEIDSLEKSEFEAVRFLDYRELFMPWALAALLLLLGESFLRHTLLRRAP